MKSLLIVPVAALSLSLSFAPAVQASNVAQNLCEYVAVDDKSRLRSYLKSQKLKLRTIFDGVQCNGQNLLMFADSNKSVKTGKMIISKVSKSIVETNMVSFKTDAMSTAANKRVNG